MQYNVSTQPSCATQHEPPVEYDGCASILYDINHSTQLLVPLQLT